jgi:hypothetical protein
MGKSFSIPLMYIDTLDNTLKMDTGKTVSLREDPYSSDLYVLSETSAGVYKHDNVEDKIVRLFVNGAYKSDYGTFRTYGDLANMLAPYFKKDGSVAMTGEFNGGDFRMHHIGDPVSGIDVGDRDYNDARYVLQSNYADVQPGKVLYVSNLFTDVTGRRYASIQSAVNYAASQSPYQANYWKIYVYPHSNADAGYTENLTFQPNIKITGIGLVKISGSVSGFSQYTSFENIQFQYSGNLTFNNSAALRNCNIRLTGSSSVAITLDTLKGLNIGLITTHANHSITSSGNNNITGWTNKEFTMQDTDKIYVDLLGISNIDIADPNVPEEE